MRRHRQAAAAVVPGAQRRVGARERRRRGAGGARGDGAARVRGPRCPRQGGYSSELDLTEPQQAVVRAGWFRSHGFVSCLCVHILSKGNWPEDRKGREGAPAAGGEANTGAKRAFAQVGMARALEQSVPRRFRRRGAATNADVRGSVVVGLSRKGVRAAAQMRMRARSCWCARYAEVWRK